MRELRRRHRDFAEEEKKSDDPLRGKLAQDAPLIGQPNPPNDGVPSPPSRKKGRPLLLLVCASGITSCYLWYGAVQEQVYLLDQSERGGGSGGEKGADQSITLFLLATGTFSAFLLALVWSFAGPLLLIRGSSSDGPQRVSSQGEQRGLNHPLIIFTSISYLSAMSCSNESLRFVSYPTCVLAKSSKLIPTLLAGWTVDKVRSLRGEHQSQHASINRLEWLGAALITLGIVSFQYVQLHRQANHNNLDRDGHEEKGDSPYGLALLMGSLLCDGIMAGCQSLLKQKNSRSFRPPSAMETMMWLNVYATIILASLSHYSGQLQRGFDILLSNNSTKSWLLFQLNFSASLGQVFVFLTIHNFSPLTTTTITTTRKFFTILLSVYKFGHVLTCSQWFSVCVVFVGLYLGIIAKFIEKPDMRRDNVKQTKSH